MASVVAEVCMYGTGKPGCGAGYIARTADGTLFGDGEPVDGRNYTSALWRAVDELTSAGISRGLIRVFAAGGGRYADVPINAVSYYGTLPWVSPAPVYEISYDDLMAVAEPVS